MTPVLKTTLFFYLIAIINPHVVIGYCTTSFNPLQCQYDVYCHNRFDLGNQYSKDDFRYDNRPDHQETPEDACKTIETNDGWSTIQYYPLYLHYKNNDIDNTRIWHTTEGTDYVATLPELHDEVNNRLLNIIAALDLSNNNFDVVPEIRGMENLEFLDLSKNSIKVAILSNTVELRALTKIDLSHNIITNVQYESEHIYKGLKNIDLSHNNLSNISEIFAPFDDLETLDVSQNYIDNLSPMTFEGIKLLKHFNISFNRICDINSSLFRFNTLKTLDLSHNKIQTIRPIDLNKLTKLETLYLNSNFLSVIEKNSFDDVPLLKNLYLNNNKLENIDKDIFSHVTNLDSIDLSENHFKTLPKGLFKNRSIKLFSIINNLMEGSINKGTFEGLPFVTEMDLSSQYLDTIEDYAFYGLDHLAVLLLNNNKIKLLSSKCFGKLRTLEQLNLSFNEIENIDFEKEDLSNLFSLSLKNNNIKELKHEVFYGLSFLQYLDLSNNNILHVESNALKSLNGLIRFEISNNPLNETLVKGTFNGLDSLPSLDISYTLLETIQNSSFAGMLELKNVNVSHSKIKTLEYNIFSHTGAIKTIDLSFNELIEFNINSTELTLLDTLLLNNNKIKSLGTTTFQHIPLLKKLILSYNTIENINVNTFTNQESLEMLDLSFNQNLKFIIPLLNEKKSIAILDLSGIKTGVHFDNTRDETLSQLTISYASVSDIKALQINNLRHLETLTLSYNDISIVEDGCFNDINSLRILDLSHNKIANIVPGVFKDNTMLVSLNVSHNFLTAIPYGIFRGLLYLDTLDISFNSITDLQNERFYEINSLSILVADYNKIESINAAEFTDTNLTQLSIGGNPIPCEILANINVPFQITAIRLYEKSEENVHGVTCNKRSSKFDRDPNMSISNSADSVQVLFNIRDMLSDQFHKHQSNATSLILANFNETNILLNRILKVMLQNSAATIPVAESHINSNNILLSTEVPKHETFRASAESKSLFTEICVALILLVLVGFVLFKVYMSRISLRQRFSTSTREFPDAMDSTL